MELGAAPESTTSMLARWEASATLVAVMVATVLGATTAGAMKRPVAVMVPMLVDQATASLLRPTTEAEICREPPGATFWVWARRWMLPFLLLKLATTSTLLLAWTVHVPMPEQAPDQPVKEEPGSATAVRTTDVPLAMPMLQAVTWSQFMPPGLLEIVPRPEPAMSTLIRPTQGDGAPEGAPAYPEATQGSAMWI